MTRFCRPDAYALLRAQLPRLSTIDGLVHGAVAIAMHAMPDVDSPSGVERALQAMRDRIRLRVPSGAATALLAHAHAVLFDDGGLCGDEDDYFDPRNSYLPEVLARRRGLPISLSLVYKATLVPLGVDVEGIAAPGHFMVQVSLPHEPALLVDPFARGRMLSRREALEKVAQLTQQPFRDAPELLPIADHRSWLVRMLNNLQTAYGRAGRRDDHAAMSELRALLASA